MGIFIHRVVPEHQVILKNGKTILYPALYPARKNSRMPLLRFSDHGFHEFVFHTTPLLLLVIPLTAGNVRVNFI